MKKSRFILPGILFVILLVFSGCKKKVSVEPCDKTGRICFTNKLDSTATIKVVQMNHLFDLDRNFIECLVVTGDNPYNFKISCNTYYLDTTIMILSCDDIQLVLK
ncbi:MAG: hypothetical protein ABIJ04_04080 [Bacteroidota bacterium]